MVKLLPMNRMVRADAAPADSASAAALRQRSFFMDISPGYWGTITSGHGAGKAGGARFEGVGHFEKNFLERSAGGSLQQAAGEFERHGEIHASAVSLRREAPVIFQPVERTFDCDHIDGPRGGIQGHAAGVA